MNRLSKYRRRALEEEEKLKKRNDFLIWLFVIAFTVLTINMAGASEWETRDKYLMQSYVLMSTTDILQTRKILSKDGREMNPLLGNHPSTTTLIAVKGVAAGSIYLMADSIGEHRTFALLMANIIQFAVVRHNYSVMMTF